MKRILSFCLVFCLILSMFALSFNIGVSAESVGTNTKNLRSFFEDDNKGEFFKENDGYIGIPVNLTTFVRDSVASRQENILYIVGTKAQRIGTASDYEIIDDMLNQGYIVTVLDYMDNELAAGTPLSYSITGILANEVDNGKYTCGYPYKTMFSYAIPAGCTIVRDIVFYHLDTMGINGTNEYILWLWNEFYAGENGIKKDANGNDLPYAETIYDCIKKDGSPMDFKLYMDIIYPVNPSDDTVVPVMAHASNSEEKAHHISRYDSSTVYYVQGVMDGYATVLYDHEYIPMSRTDHYGYYGNYDLPLSSFTTTYCNGNAVHSAAIRAIRYYAEDYGYNGDYICVTGFSKSSFGPAILADTTHESRGEILNYADYLPEGVDPYAYMGEQPFLYDRHGNPLDSNVTVVYSGSGPGVCNYGSININDNCVPFASTIGTADTMGSFNTFIDETSYLFDKANIESLFYTPKDLQHYVAWGYEDAFQRENVDIVWEFLDNHIRAAYRAEAPKVLYMTPKDNVVFDSPEEVMLKFSRAMDSESVNEKVYVISNRTGKRVYGEWVADHGNTTYRFALTNVLNADKYTVIVPKGTLAKDGVGFNEEYRKSFTLSGSMVLSPEDDIYLTSNGERIDDGLFINVCDKEGNVEAGLISFYRNGGFADTFSALLTLPMYSGNVSSAQIFAMNGEIPKDITYEKLSELPFELVAKRSTSTGVLTVDVSDFIAENTSENVTFLIKALMPEGTKYFEDFNDKTTSNFKNATHYVHGGGTSEVEFTNGAMKFYNRPSGHRVKYIDALGVKEIGSELLGAEFTITAKIMPTEDTSVFVGLYAQTGVIGYTGYGGGNYEIKANVWNEITHKVIITNQMVELNTDCVAFKPDGVGDFLLDDITVSSDTSGTNFITIEGKTDYNNSAMLALWVPEVEEKIGNVAVIGSGTLSDTVIDGKVTVNANGTEETFATKKGYIKVPLNSFDKNAETIELQFNVAESVNNTVSIYGILDDETRFAENFDGNITWNTAYANYGNGVLKSAVYGGKPLASVYLNDKTVINADVKDYVLYMAEKGYKAVTFMLVAEEADSTYTVDFNGYSDYINLVKNSELKNYPHSIKVDPTDQTNDALYFEKSGFTSPNGYQQTLSLTKLLSDKDLFTAEDIGSVITVSYRQYNVVSSEHSDCVDFSKVWKSGVHTSTMGNLSYVTKTVTQNGKSVTTTPMNSWYQVKFTINVTKEAVQNYSEHTAIVIATGWTASATYIDDIVVTKTAAEATLNSLPDNTPVAFTDFSNGKSINYKANSHMNGYEIGVKPSPTDSNNNTFYMQKSAATEPANGYHQNIALNGLIKKNGVFTSDDLGNKYTITYKQYNSVGSQHDSCYHFGTIGKAGTATASIYTPFVTRTFSYNGNNVSNSQVPMNDWYTVKFTFTVTEDVIKNYSDYTSIIIAVGWTANGVYVDDIKVDVIYGEKVDNSTYVPFTNFTNLTSYEKVVRNSWNSENKGFKYGVTKAPNNNENDVFYYDKAGAGNTVTNSYLQNLSLTGLIKVNDKFTADDIGKKYTVSYMQYNVIPSGITACTDFSVIGLIGGCGTVDGGTAFYQLPSFIKKNVYYNGEKITNAAAPLNDWYKVEFTFTITEAAVEKYSDYTAIIPACGTVATRTYIDNIKVSIEGETVDLGEKAGLVYDCTIKDEYSAMATISAETPDANGKADIISLYRTPANLVEGIRKVYASFDKGECEYIVKAYLNVTAPYPQKGNILYIYGINGTVNIQNLTYNNAFGNDKLSYGFAADNTYNGEPIAVITLSDETAYTVDITDYVLAMNGQTFTIGISGESQQSETEIGSITAEILHTPPFDGSTVTGDVNNDGKIDTTDLAVLKLYLAGSGNVGEGADINSDGTIDTTDLAKLKLTLAGNN